MNREHAVKSANGQMKFSAPRLAQMGMLSAIAVVLILYVRIPLIPAASYLVYDMADVPVLLGAYLLGPLAGLLILTAVSAIQAFMLGGNGIIGFIMHMSASGALVLVAALFYRRLGKSNHSLIVSLAAGGLSMTALMIPLNLIFTPLLFGMPLAAVVSLILPVLLPFNLIKAGLNAALFFLLFKSLRSALKGKNFG
jgi:riboflavin transporter FmnP